jgi:hypothetical protein
MDSFDRVFDGGGIIHPIATDRSRESGVEPERLIVYARRLSTCRRECSHCASTDSVPVTNAPLLVAPGSHKRRIPTAEIPEVTRQYGVIPCLAEAGDIWLYLTHILHASDAAGEPHTVESCRSTPCGPTSRRDGMAWHLSLAFFGVVSRGCDATSRTRLRAAHSCSCTALMCRLTT